MADSSIVLVDTDVFSTLYFARGREKPRSAQWRAQLEGRIVTIAVQTRTEVLAGFLSGGWGERRLSDGIAQLDSTPTFAVDRDVADACAHLAATLRSQGHALQAKQHTGDRWIAATAIHHGIPLLSGDGIYEDVPGLTLLP